MRARFLLGDRRGAQPPAMAGMMDTSSFSEIGVCRFSKNRMSSSLTKMFTNLLTFPSASQIRSFTPGNCWSISSINCPSELGLGVTTS